MPLVAISRRRRAAVVGDDYELIGAKFLAASAVAFLDRGFEARNAIADRTAYRYNPAGHLLPAGCHGEIRF